MSEAYIYQPESRVADYQQAVALLRSRYASVVEGWIDPRTCRGELIRGFEQNRIEVRKLAADAPEYRHYFHRAEYATRYPQYYSFNLPEKSFEHFLALRLLGLTPEDTFIDLASEGSPLPEIVGRLYSSVAYAQDIMFEPGIHGSLIGGDACEMPVPDGFASRAALTCSLEHFESDADTRLFRELCRVLRPGGRVVVAPLYVYRHAAVQTDPTYSASVSVPFDVDATIFCAKGWGNRHGRFYSPETLSNRIVGQCPEMRFTIYEIVGAESIDSSVYAAFALTATRR